MADALLDDQVCRFQPATSAPPRLSPQCVHKDMIWGGKDLTVGPAAMATLVTETRKAYPDLVFEITQVCSVFYYMTFSHFHNLFVHTTMHGAHP